MRFRVLLGGLETCAVLLPRGAPAQRRTWLVRPGDSMLIAWATFGLLRERPDAAWRTLGIPAECRALRRASFVKHAGHFGAVVSRARQFAGEGGRQL